LQKFEEKQLKPWVFLYRRLTSSTLEGSATFIADEHC